ncbi:MAG TPA: hypothetical protein VGI48_09870 [Caldimonas sp.]
MRPEPAIARTSARKLRGALLGVVWQLGIGVALVLVGGAVAIVMAKIRR